MKYPVGRQTVEAVYDNEGTRNPLIEALPGDMDVGSFYRQINDLSMFVSGRVKVIPFEHYFEEKDRNLNMIAELTTPDGLSAILNWALEGWRLLESTGFNPPQSVLNATSAYYQESDKVGRFMDECMVANAAGFVSTRATYERYKNWCMESGLRPLGEPDFKKSMERKNIRVGRPRVNGSQITAYIGWQLAPLQYGSGLRVLPAPGA